MKYFVYGLVFIFFSIFVEIPYLDLEIQILPAFVGYLLLIKPIRTFKKIEKSFEEIEYLSIAMFIFTLIEFISGIVQFDLMFKNELVASILHPVSTMVIPLFITYRIIWSLRTIEFSKEIPMDTEPLTQLWIYLLIIFVVGLFLNDSLFISIVTLASYLVKAMIIFYLSRSIKLYKVHSQGDLS